MTYDVVVVGGGIGGLTVAALLSARGVNTCLLERQSQVGGCVGRVEFSGYEFEPGMGLYPAWNPGEIHDRIFSELSVSPPETHELESEYVVRLPDGTDVRLSSDNRAFADELSKAFPECAVQAIAFYERSKKTADAWLRALTRVPDLQTPGQMKRFQAFLPEAGNVLKLFQSKGKTALESLRGTSARFQRFIDSQLRAFTHIPLDQCSDLAASIALNLPRRQLFSIVGGPAALAERLADSMTRAGGTLRLDSPVLRLAWDNNGQVAGVDLLSGETILAKQGVVSNMTVWDTYGKLIGLNRTPLEVKTKLNSLHGVGSYVIYAGMEEAAVARIPASHLLVINDEAQPEEEREQSEFTFVASSNDNRAPAGKRAVTLQTITDVDRWFTFQSNEEEHEQRDQAMLESFWGLIHRHLPELGGDIEVIETANPRTLYDLSRRKLGMTEASSFSAIEAGDFNHRTSIPNVFMVADTVFPGGGLAAVSNSALIVANELTR